MSRNSMDAFSLHVLLLLYGGYCVKPFKTWSCINLEILLMAQVVSRSITMLLYTLQAN